MNGRERVQAMIGGRPVDRLPLMPITMMFAADRAGVKYRDYVRDHRVLARAQLHTAERFGLDYVSTISDPAREAADLGAGIEWFADQPPAIVEDDALLADKAALARMKLPDPLGGGRMHDRVLGIALLNERVAGRLIVEGWVEGPCAMGADLRGINRLMLDLYDDSGFVADLFDFAVAMELAFARAQVEAGATLIGIGDAAASLIGPVPYRKFVWPREKRLIDGIHEMGCPVRLHICGRTRRLFPEMGRLGADVVDLDYLAPIDEARAAMGPDQTLLGNIEPVGVLRNGTPETVAAAIAECHAQAGPRYIAGAGCETVRDTPDANFEALCSYAHTTAAAAAWPPPATPGTR
ncbi:MAG: uroporphyrinogen decarboxylase family protein [Bryobacteraceae bacterium]|nr:uroporphyrinogen decarboxylase family protein [Bryobacteraceae bacterium]